MNEILHTHQAEAAQAQFAEKSLFTCLYVNSARHTATYTVMNADDLDYNDVLFFKTVDMFTGEIVGEGSRFDNELTAALRSHYNAEFIRRDAIVLSFELNETMTSYVDKEGQTSMHNHIVFGQSVFYADLDQLETKDVVGMVTYIVK